MTKIQTKLRIDTSNSSFRETREGQLYYVDKTDFIEDFITNVPKKASVITRPTLPDDLAKA